MFALMYPGIPPRRFVCLLLTSLWVLFSVFPLTAAYVVYLNLSHVRGNGWQVHDANLKVIWHSAAQIDVQLSVASLQLPPPLDQLKSLHVACAAASIHGNIIRCESGTLQVHTPLFEQTPIGISFRYQQDSRAVHFTLKNVGFAQGRIDIEGQSDQEHWHLTLNATALDIAQLPQKLAPLFQQHEFFSSTGITSSGVVNVKARLSGQDNQVQAAELSGSLREFTFSDREAQRAGEKLSTTFEVRATKQADQWRLHTNLLVHSGQLYIEPVFFEVSNRPLSLALTGSFQPTTGHLSLTTLHFDHSGILQANGQLQLLIQDTPQLASAQLYITPAPLSDLYKTYLHPFLIGTALDALDTNGHVSLSLAYHREGPTLAKATLSDVALADQKGRFGLRGLTGTFTWANEKATPTPSRLRWQDGSIYNIGIGAGQLLIEAQGDTIHLLQRTLIPVLDGGLQIDSLLAKHIGTPQLQWEFEGSLTPVSMEAFSQAMGWPTMSGQLSGTIPRVTYADGTMTVDGSLQMQVFDGEVTVHNLHLEQPFSLVPQLSADIDLNNVDLERLTGTFAFGKITGKLGGYIHNLQLQDWQPVAFDAHFATPPGDRSKHTISQRAVDSLSSLGGISGALSRSFLRVFDEFSYDRLGLSCRLRNRICEMGGVEPVNDGYYIVKGGRLPRINIIGYVRQVDWPELLERLRRATQSSGPVLQ